MLVVGKQLGYVNCCFLDLLLSTSSITHVRGPVYTYKTKEIAVVHVDRAAYEMLSTSAHPEIVVLVVLVLVSVCDHSAAISDESIVYCQVYASRNALFKGQDASCAGRYALMSHGLEEEWYPADSCQTVVIAIHVGSHAIQVSDQPI